jgi:hypothetical protein
VAVLPQRRTGAPTPSPSPSPTLESSQFGLTGGNGQAITAGNGVKSAFQGIGTTTQDLEALRLRVFGAAARAHRVDVRIAGGIKLPDLLIPVATNFTTDLLIPIHIASGSLIEMAMQTNAVGVTCHISASGIKSTIAETITTYDRLAPLGASSDLDGVLLTEGGGWVEVGTLSADSRSYIPSWTTGTKTTGRTAGRGHIEFSYGADATAAEANKFLTLLHGGSTTNIQDMGTVFWKALPAGTKMWARALSNTGADTLGLQLHAGRA